MRRIVHPNPAPPTPWERIAALWLLLGVAWLIAFLVGMAIRSAAPASHTTPLPAPATSPATSPDVVIVPNPAPTDPAPAGADPGIDPAATYAPIPAGLPTTSSTSAGVMVGSAHAGMLPRPLALAAPLAAVAWPWAHLPGWQLLLPRLAVVVAGIAVITILTSSDRAQAAVRRHPFASSVFLLVMAVTLVRMVWQGGVHLVVRAIGAGVLFVVLVPVFTGLFGALFAIWDWRAARRRRRAYDRAYQAQLMRTGGWR